LDIEFFFRLQRKAFRHLAPYLSDTGGDFSPANGAAPLIMAGIKAAVVSLAEQTRDRQQPTGG